MYYETEYTDFILLHTLHTIVCIQMINACIHMYTIFVCVFYLLYSIRVPVIPCNGLIQDHQITFSALLVKDSVCSGVVRVADCDYKL